MSIFNKSPQSQFGKPTVSDKPAYRSPAGMPMFDRSTVSTGSRGGAVIWVMKEAFMQKGVTGRPSDADEDGFAVFGRYPRGFLAHVLRLKLMGNVKREDILHVCSGTLSQSEKWTVDIRTDARPFVCANGTALPFSDSSFPAIMIDPPYSDEYARNLYGTENPRPSWLLKEAARVVRPQGRIGLLHVAVPFPPKGCWLVNVYGITTGVGYRIRAFTLFEKWQEGLF